MNDLSNVFVKELSDEFIKLKESVPQVQIEYLLGSFYTTISLLVNNRISIQPKNHPKTNANIYMMNVGGSGAGKSISSRPFINVLGMLQKEEREKYTNLKKLAEACRAKERDSDRLTPEEMENFAKGWLIKNGHYEYSQFSEWTTEIPNPKEFYITDFTPEALSKINNSFNRTGFIYADEFDKLISSVTRTKTVNDPNQFFTSLFDGEHVSIVRKHLESESIDISLCLLINTTTENFNASINKNGFFHNGFGARFLYVYNESDYERHDLVPIIGSSYEHFCNKMYELLNTCYNYYFKDEEEVLLVVPEDLFPIINEAEKSIEKKLDESDLPENMISTYKTRVRLLLMKLILLTEVINHTYRTKNRIPKNMVDIDSEMISRGIVMMNFFVDNFISLFSTKKKIKPEFEDLLSQLTKGNTYEKDYLLSLTKVSEPTLRRFLDSRHDLFSSEIVDRKKQYTFI